MKIYYRYTNPTDRVHLIRYKMNDALFRGVSGKGGIRAVDRTYFHTHYGLEDA